MQSSMFNLRVPLQERNEVFLMNTITDAQLLVSADVAALLDGPIQDELEEEACEAVTLLQENGFLVQSREHDRRALDTYLTRVKSDTSELNVTVLTTLQCNFACDYCFQGDHGDYNKFAEKMTLETARRVATWIEREMDRVRPEKFVMTFFGGEPLLNLPVMYELAERLARASDARGIRQVISIITNGLLLTEEVVDRLVPYGLTGVKITLDGDRDTHNRMRPLRGGQGTFDRIIDNIRRVSDWREFRRIVGRQLSGASRVSEETGVRRSAREGELQADCSQRRPRLTGGRPGWFPPKKHPPPDPGRR
jgi:uncharacterized protein